MRKTNTPRQFQRASLAHLTTPEVDPNAVPIDWLHQNVDIERRGKKITLPDEPGPMPIEAAIESLERLKYDEEQETTVDERIMAHPLEAAVAFVAAMEHLYGWASPVPTPTFFGPKPPHFITVQVDVDEYIQVPWGSFRIPGVENDIQIQSNRDNKGQLFLQIFGTVRKRERGVLLELAAATREFLRDKSIYRGKALSIRTDGDGQLDMENPPEFMDVRAVNPSELILNKDVDAQVNTNVYAPIMHTDKVREAGIPLKRGVLLEGRYGVGKTMTTRITAKHCIDHGWTFINVDRAASLREALTFAQRYQPAVVFCEDIDRATGERDEAANDLLNTIDGILSKNAEVMVVMTTNHVERIEPAMLRPGRLDAVISVLPPDGEAVGRLITLYSRGLLREGESLDEVGQVLAGNIPAVIREVVERSKLAMIANGHQQLTEEDLLVSARGMQAHLALLDPREPAPSAEEQVGISLRGLFEKTLGLDAEDEDAATTDDVKQLDRNVRGGIAKVLELTSETALHGRSAGKRIEKMGDQINDLHKAVV